MASKKIVVDLELSGNRINNALVQLLTQQEVSAATATMAKGAGQLGFYNGTVYRSVQKTSNTYHWKALADAKVLSDLAATVASVADVADTCNEFRDDYASVSGAVSGEVKSNLEMDYNSQTKLLNLLWDSSPILNCSVDMSQFLIDGMLSGAHIIDYNDGPNYSYDGGTITIDETIVDGKTVTDDESGFPSPITTPTKEEGKYLRLVFNTEPANTKTAAWIDVTSLADIYTAGNGIDIVSNAISVYVKQNKGLGFDAGGLCVKVDGTSVTFDNQGRLTASSSVLSQSGRVEISDGELMLTGFENRKVLEMRMKDYDGNEVVCEKQLFTGSGEGEVFFLWNIGDYVEPSTLTDADYYYYEVYYV